MSTAGLAGRRYVESKAYQEAREAGVFKTAQGFPSDLAAVSVLDTRELADLARRRSFDGMFEFDIEGVPFVGEQPGAALVHNCVQTIPTERVQVELAVESPEIITATAVPTGTPLPQTDLEFGGSTPRLQGLDRFGLGQPVTLGELDQPGEVEALITRRLEYGWGLGLDNDLLVGSNKWPGAIPSVTVPMTVAKSSGTGNYRATAIRQAVGLVQNNGFYSRKLQVVMNPVTMGSLWNEEDGSNRPLGIMDMFATSVDWFIPSNRMTAGEALVGDLFAAIGLFLKGPLDVELSTEHADYFTRGMVMLKLACRAYGWVRQPAALSLVTGLT